MNILIKNATVLHPASPHHKKKVDILIENGILRSIGSQISETDCTVIEHEHLHVSVGWMDCFANFCDPGYEYNETVISGSKAAATGGFTDVMLIPNTLPVVSNKGQVEYLMQRAKSTLINLHPIGSITQQAEEKELAEMIDMSQAGAIAFSDGTRPVQSGGFLQKALEYVLAIDSTIIQLPDDQSIGKFGLMNEGVMSTRLGLPGKPAISEELMLARDIELLKYTGSKLHFTGISTKKSVELIARAKQDGLHVTCSVTPYHLFFSDEELASYDTNMKVNPPLRTPGDREALVKAVQEGIVDCVASHHQPRDYDHKICEFEKASFGMETLETVFSAVIASGISYERFVTMQTENVRKIFGVKMPLLAEGDEASLTLFDPHSPVSYTKKSLKSKSTNNAFLGRDLRGRILGIVNKRQTYLPEG